MGNQADRPSESLGKAGLILVKHARPILVPGEPPSTWSISPEGRADAQALARKLAAFAPTAIVSSTEQKAAATADEMGEVFGLAPGRDLGLREHFGDTMAFFEEAVFQAKVAAFFANARDLVLGEETGEEAHARFAGAVDRQRAAHPEGTLVLVAHGRVITLWAQRRLGIDPMPFWRGLTLASALVVGEDASFEIVS